MAGKAIKYCPYREGGYENPIGKSFDAYGMLMAKMFNFCSFFGSW